MIADYTSPTSLSYVFRDAYAIFAITDFWCLHSPISVSLHGQNIADAAAKVATLKHFIWSSLPSAKAASNGHYRNAVHFDTKADIERYVRERCGRLVKVMTVLWVGAYFQSWKILPEICISEKVRADLSSGSSEHMCQYIGRTTESGSPKQLPDGAFEVASPIRGSTGMPSVSVSDVGKVVCAILGAGDLYKNKTISVFSTTQTPLEKLRIWSKVTGRQANFRQVDPAKYEETLMTVFPRYVAVACTEQWLLLRDFPNTFLGREIISATKAFPQIQFTSWEEYVSETDWLAEAEAESWSYRSSPPYSRQ
ncbi:MAG: hypothetical protein M1827_000722 [Pycnora praestabilis]|nr:MAG: hypothetical protein M1827_000722 [Pycnora praestabilis]